MQFSIRLLLILTAVVAATVNVAVGQSSLGQMIVLEALAVLFASVPIILALAASGSLRAFWIGVSICAGLAAVLATVSLPLLIRFGANVPSKTVADIEVADLIQSSVMPGLWFLAPVNGLLCMFVHRLACRGRGADHATENQISK